MMSLLHKTIKKVQEDIVEYKFNTAISAMMIYVNKAEKQGVSKISYLKFVTLLAPFAPHLTEQIWSEFELEGSIHNVQYPQFDPDLTVDKEVTIGVQINGKMRGNITLPPEASEADALELVKNDQVLSQKIAGEELKKVIYVPGRILNLIVS